MKPTRPLLSFWHKPAAIRVASDDGVLEYHLSGCTAGLFVERIEQRAAKARVSQSAIFKDTTAFERWCDADVARFDYPLVYVNLRRNGDRVLG